MQPNAPTPAPNQYDYILNPQTAPKKKLVFGGGKNTKLVSVVFILFVIVVVIIGFSVISSLGKTNYAPVADLAERQTEIVRIADIGLLKARDPNTVMYVSTIRNVTLSEKTATLAFLKKKSFKLSAKQLLLKKDTSTDKALTTAEQNNNYDQVLLGKLNGLVADYQKATKNVDGINGSASEKALFASISGNAKIIDNAK